METEQTNVDSVNITDIYPRISYTVYTDDGKTYIRYSEYGWYEVVSYDIISSEEYVSDSLCVKLEKSFQQLRELIKIEI